MQKLRAHLANLLASKISKNYFVLILPSLKKVQQTLQLINSPTCKLLQNILRLQKSLLLAPKQLMGLPLRQFPPGTIETGMNEPLRLTGHKTPSIYQPIP